MLDALALGGEELDELGAAVLLGGSEDLDEVGAEACVGHVRTPSCHRRRGVSACREWRRSRPYGWVVPGRYHPRCWGATTYPGYL